MKIEELIEELLKIKDRQDFCFAERQAKKDGDPQDDHMEADELLLKYIGNEEVKEAFESIEKWYA